MKKMLTILLVTMLLLSMSSVAFAWSSSTPPNVGNTGSLSTTGENVAFGSSGIRSSIDTKKCYTGISTYKLKASGLYLAGNSEKLVQ